MGYLGGAVGTLRGCFWDIRDVLQYIEWVLLRYRGCAVGTSRGCCWHIEV